MRIGCDSVILLNTKYPPCRGFFRTWEGNYATVTFALRHGYVHEFEDVSSPLLFWDYCDELFYKKPYDFYAELNDLSADHIGANIFYSALPTFIWSCKEQIFRIDLSEEEQDEIVKVLDDHCKRNFEKSCKEIMMEIREEVAEYGRLQL